MNPTTPRIAIVGGGLTGLAAAHALVERSHRAFTLFESAPHAGGIVQTRHERGFVLEEGPDSFITDKPEALDLVRRLGLAGEVRGTRPEFRRSFVVHGGRLVPTPDGFYLLAPARLGPVWASPLFSPWGKLRLALEPWVPRARGLDDPAYDESLASFVRRRLGGEVLERIAQAMVGGIYGAAPEELSLAATFPRFLAWEREFGSVTRGLRQQADARAASASGPRYGLFATLANGMQTLTDALIARLPDGALRPLSPVRALDPDPSGGWRVSGEHYDTVILALPAAGAAALVAGFDAALAADLGAYTAGSSVTVSLAYPASAVAHSLDGAGFVVPRGEAAALGGLVGGSFTHRKFEGRAPEGTALVRLFYGDDALALDDADVVAHAHAALGRLVGAQAPPKVSHVARWPGGMPRYRVGHLAQAAATFAAADRHPGLHLAGNAYGGVGLSDCIRGGESAAAAALGAGPFAAPAPPARLGH